MKTTVKAKVHFIGSVAFYYKTILAEAASEMGIRLSTAHQEPDGRSDRISQVIANSKP